MNLKHLRYFWAVASFGGVSRAAEKLELSPQTLSGQIADLQLELGVQLLQQIGRGLELTDAGRVAYSYADEIFGLADELATHVRAMPSGRSKVFRVGITDAVPRSLAYRLLAPIIADGNVRLTASHDRLDVLLAELGLHQLELVIADRPTPSGSAIRAFNHVLGDSGVGLFAAPSLAQQLRPGFPATLKDVPLLIPGGDSVLHNQFRVWLEAQRLGARIVGEFEDGGLMKTFGASGAGAFPAAVAVRAEVERLYGVEFIGLLEGVSERFYAISTERRATDPQVKKILALADRLLSEPGSAPKRKRRVARHS